MTESASSAPIVKAFRILGLHGYKDIDLTFHGPARIAIAENGAGKTTILSALHAFLSSEFERLRNLSFDTIECELSHAKTTLAIRREQLVESFDPRKELRVAELARFTDLDANELRRVILSLDSIDHNSITSDTDRKST